MSRRTRSRRDPHVIAAESLAIERGLCAEALPLKYSRCELVLCVGSRLPTQRFDMEAVSSEEWTGKHFMIKKFCAGGYCTGVRETKY